MAAPEIRQLRAAILGARGRSARPALRWPRWSLRRAALVSRRGLARVLPDLLAIELLIAAVLFLFRDAWLDGYVFHEADTSTMFYPIFAALRAALARGELLLWSPELFSGFPLLAEGQTGVLYPLNWVAAALLPTDDGFIWLRIVQVALGVLFAYLLGRTLRLAPGPAAIMGLSFGLGSFIIGQLQHGSVLASAIWLPLVLALSELGFRARGLSRLRWLLLAGAALGLSALGVHMQTVIMAGGCFLAWVAFRLVLPPARPGERALIDSRRAVRVSPRATALAAGRFGRGLAGRVGLAVWVGATVPVLGMALAAAQILPLYELSGQSGRASGWSYQAATDYSLPLPNLLTLVFPFFFGDGRGGWALWQPWEVTFYAGVVPLALAVLGVGWGRRREVLFFLPLLVVATLLALGDYSPINLYAQVWNWPGMNMQRAPARFSYLGVLGIAGLAGLGGQVLWESLRPAGDGSPRDPASRGARLLVVWLAGLALAPAVLVWHLVAWRTWLASDPLWAVRFIEEQYLSQRHDPGAIDSAQKVYSGLWQALDLANPRTALPLLLLAALLALVVCWSELRRLRMLWQALLVVLVAVDMVSFAQGFHPLVSIDEIADVGPIGRFLAEQSGQFRISTDPDVTEPKPNELLPWGISETRAYDPLELSRDRVFVGAVSYVDNWLLDLLGVRYRLVPADGPGMPSYRQTGFNPQHPLVSGSAVNPSGREAWTVPGEVGDELRVVSALEDAVGVRDGEPVAEWVLTEVGGGQRRFTMLAGRDTADWAYDDPALAIPPAHQRARVAFTYELPLPTALGTRQVHLYYTSFDLPDRPRIERAEFRQIGPVGRMQVFGFGFFNKDRGLVAQFFDREKYRPVLQQAGVLVQENRASFPRAFAVPEAVVAPDAEAAMSLLAHGPLQPRRQVVLEAPGPAASSPAPSVAADGDRLGAPYGQVDVVEYRNEQVSLEASSDGGYLVLTDAYYPGWRAYVDGVETPIYRGDYLFRAVELPPGRHLVQFRYQPESFETGLAIARLTLALLGLALLVTLAPAAWARRPSWPRTA